MTDAATLYDRLDTVQRVWLGLLALMPDGVRPDAIERVCTLGALIPRVRRWTSNEISAPFAAAGLTIPVHMHHGFQLTDADLRRRALDKLVSSGTAARWSDRLTNPIWRRRCLLSYFSLCRRPSAWPESLR